MTREKRARIAEPVALLRSDPVNLGATAAFIEMVYLEGCYLEPKAYTKRVRKDVKAVDSVIVRLAREGARIKTNQPSLARTIFALAEIRDQLDGHYWRAEWIIEDMEARTVARTG